MLVAFISQGHTNTEDRVGGVLLKPGLTVSSIQCECPESGRNIYHTVTKI